MNTTIIIAIVAVLICICSSISGGAAFYMNQETEVPKSSPPPTGSPPPPAGSPPPPTGSPPPPTGSPPPPTGSGVTCKADGTWSNNSPVPPGTVITKSCPTGGSQTAKCKADGSWESDWQCSGASPAASAVNANPGEAISCTGYNPKGEGAIYRYDGDKKMRHYPTADIAGSWDPNWGSGAGRKIDCTGFTLGTDIALQVTASTPAPPPAGVTCKADGTWSNNSPVSPGTVITKSCSPGSIVRAKCKADGGWDSDNKCSPAFKPDNRTIKSRRRDNFCIDVPGWSKDNGTQMTMWDCHGGENQQFKMDDKQRLVNKNSGKCLDVSGGSGAGATVVQWDCHDGNNQKWEYDEKGRLHPVHAMDKCLDITDASNVNGAKLLIWDCSDGNHQQWFTESANPGDAIKCTGYNPKGDGAVYRYLSDKKMSHYPSGEIAGSWDSNWWNNPKQIDCTGFTLGADMTKLSPGDSVSCIGNEGYIQRYVGDKTIRGYPSMEIADSWDSNWRSNKVIDCTGLKTGPVMEKAKETPWNNCAVWGETTPGKHDDWCRNDFGSHATHVGQGQHGCTLGWGKGVCKN